MPLPADARPPSQRTLPLYRGAIVLLLLVTAALGWALQRTLDKLPQPRRPAAEPPSPTATIVDVAARFAAMVPKGAAVADLSESYYSSPKATVHMHVMGFGQRCPLHVHRNTHEATAIVDGTAEIMQITRENGTLQTRKDRYSTGDVIASSPGCGHEFVNGAADALLGNLVFATPPFDGNHYVTATDARLAAGAAPFAMRPAEALRQLTAAGLPSRIVPVPDFAGRLDLVMVRTGVKLPAPSSGPTIIYVLAGEGLLSAPGGGPLRARHLVHLPPTIPVELQAKPAMPMAVLVFRPEQP